MISKTKVLLEPVLHVKVTKTYVGTYMSKKPADRYLYPVAWMDGIMQSVQSVSDIRG